MVTAALSLKNYNNNEIADPEPEAKLLLKAKNMVIRKKYQKYKRTIIMQNIKHYKDKSQSRIITVGHSYFSKYKLKMKVC